MHRGLEEKNTIKIILCILTYLTVIDLAVNIIFCYPEDPQNTEPSFFQSYFEQGRSVEGKLDRMTRASEGESAPILTHGWLNSQRSHPLPSMAKDHQILVALYGMSHTKLLGEAIAKADTTFIIRNVTAPGAPPNWSFAAYEADKEQHHAQAVILGIMTDNVALVTATCGGTAYFDMSYAYTFPRYLVEGNHVRALFPPFFTDEGYRDYFYNPEKWADYREWLSKNDKWYDPILFRRSLADASSLVRLLRRAYSERIRQNGIANVYTTEGFKADSEELLSLHAIVREFAQSVRAQNSIPVIYIVNLQGRGDHLYKALKPVLDAHEILYLSTHAICPPDDPRCYLAENSHFTPAKDLELARAMIKIIKVALAGRESKIAFQKKSIPQAFGDYERQ